MDFLAKVQKMDTPVILLINKIDELKDELRSTKDEDLQTSNFKHQTREAKHHNSTLNLQTSQQLLAAIVDKWHGLLPKAEILPISAKNKFGVDMLLKRIQELLPESPAYFDKDQLPVSSFRKSSARRYCSTTTRRFLTAWKSAWSASRRMRNGYISMR